MEASVSRLALFPLLSVGFACLPVEKAPPADDRACTAANHCRVTEGVAECEPGFTWRTPDGSSDDYRCVPMRDPDGGVPASADGAHTSDASAPRDTASPDRMSPDRAGSDAHRPDGQRPDTGAHVADAETPPPDAAHPDRRPPDSAVSDTRLLDGDRTDTDPPDLEPPPICLEPCPDVGASLCQAGWLRQCQLDEDGCSRWSEPAFCPSGRCEDAATCAPCAPAGLSVRHSVPDLRQVATLLRSGEGDGYVVVSTVEHLSKLSVMRTSGLGELEGTRTYIQTPGARKEGAYGGAILADHDIAVVGGRQEEDYRWRGLILRVDPDGEVVWQRHYAETSYEGRFHSAVATPQGMAVAGNAVSFNGLNTGIWFWRVDDQGDRVDSCVLSYPVEQNPYVWPAIQSRAAGGFWIAAGVTNHLGEEELWLYEISDPCVSTQKHVFSFDHEVDVKGVFERGPNEVAIFGDHGGSFLLLADREGAELSRHSFDDFPPHRVALLGDGGFVAAGRDGVSMLRVSAGGEELWRRTYGWHRYDVSGGIVELVGGGFAVAALANASVLSEGSDAVWLFTTDANGEVSRCCGDGVCALGLGEECRSCPEDCGSCAGTCCRDRSSPGCSDHDVQQCVCDYDDGCCETRWHELCASWVEDLGCGLCPPE